MSASLLAELQAAFPLLMQVAASSSVAKDLAVAEPILAGADPFDAFHDAAVDDKFKSRWLTRYLCGSRGKGGWNDPTASVLEWDLTCLVSRGLRPQELRKAFEAKLLSDGQIDDAIYEIAATAIFAQVLDQGTCRLEEPLSGSKANPDLTGLWAGKKTRVEVMRIDDLPARHDPRAREIIEGADVPGGFDVKLNFPLTSTTYAPAAKRLVEELYKHRGLARGEKVTVERFEFSVGRDNFNCANPASPVRYVEFFDMDLREVEGSVSVSPAMTAGERGVLEDESPQPEGVVSITDADHSPQSFNPTSKGGRIYGAVNVKKRQCEEGAINVVVLGLPNPIHSARTLDDGLLGSVDLRVRLPNGVEPDGGPEAIMTRTWIAPFTDLSRVSLEGLPEEEVRRFSERVAMIRAEVEMFTKISGVLGVRLDKYRPLATLRVNPNAAAPLPPGAVARVEAVALERVNAM